MVVDNAGYGQFGAVEDLNERKARDQMGTNLFGALWVTQAALPYLRVQGSGHILRVSSISGVNAYPYIGMYHASKWALAGLSQSLAQEVGPFGIRVTLIEPVGYRPTGAGRRPSTRRSCQPTTAREDIAAHRVASRPGDPTATGPVVLKLVDMAEPPLRVFFGQGANEMVYAEYDKRLAEWDRYKGLSEEAHGG